MAIVIVKQPQESVGRHSGAVPKHIKLFRSDRVHDALYGTYLFLTIYSTQKMNTGGIRVMIRKLN